LAGPLNALWYVSLGTGVIALVLLTLVVVLGVLTRNGHPIPGVPRFVALGLHRNASLLALFLVVIHVATIVSDSFAKVGWIDAVIPFVSDFRPLWIGLGTISLELFVAVIGTSLVRGLLGLRTWRIVHWLVYVSWPIAVAHGLGSGRDVGQPWMVAITVLCIGSALIAVGLRVGQSLRRPKLLEIAQPVGHLKVGVR
jgi:sulfoxide reductase heme-binding subunit YedZ